LRSLVIRFEEGSRLGRYRILRRLGAGAMGEVYLAEDPQIGRRVAIKTVRMEEGRPQELESRKKRLLREARAAGKLLHPNVVTLFDTGEDQGTLYLAFEWVDGKDLDQRMADGPPLTVGEALTIARQSAEALDYAHRQGVVHRDIKPSNVMLTGDGQAKVADFGIAKVIDSTSDLTMEGSVVGSPQYLSPEQIRGESLDGRSDIFSLGVLFYELLCRQRPFDGDTLTTLVYQILNQEPTPIEVRRPDLGSRLERLVRRMLEKDRERRFSSSAEVAAEIATCEREMSPDLLATRAVADDSTDATIRLADEASTAVREPAPPPPPPTASTAVSSVPARGRLAWVAVAAVACAALLVGLGWSARRWSAGVAERDAARTPTVGAGKVAALDEPSPVADPVEAGERETGEPAAVRPADGAQKAPEAPTGQEESAADLAFQPGERPSLARTTAGSEPVRKPPETVAAPPTADSSVESEARPTPAGAEAMPIEPPVEAPPAEPTLDPRALRETVAARVPVARELVTGMTLSIEIEPKRAAERVIVRFDRIVLGRAAEWNASKRGGRAYVIPEPGLHILTFLVDGNDVYRMRIDARPDRRGPTRIRVDLAEAGRRPRRRPNR
jgi:serine/threonine-protein kinase